MQSEHVSISKLAEHFDRVEDILDNYLFRQDIKGKDALRFSLLAEETVRLAKSIVADDTSVELWFEGNKRVSHICLELEGKIDVNTEEQFISISSTGENSADRTFFDELKSFFTKPKTPTWSLAEYEAELMMRRAQDKYAQESWDNLERSVLASLADDISVGVKDNHVLMIITKDFTESLKKVNAGKPVVSSEHIYLTPEESILEAAYQKVDKSVEKLNLNHKDALHVKLLVEETIGMVKEITTDFNALIWVEKYKNACSVKLVGNTKMDADKKYDMLSMSTDGSNSLAKGFMGKIRDIVETGTLNYESVMKLNQEYNGVAVNYGGFGIYTPVIDPIYNTGITGYLWSMNDYKNSLSAEKNMNVGMQNAWDELEKSIVASLASDVIVGVKKNRVEITIVYDIAREG